MGSLRSTNSVLCRILQASTWRIHGFLSGVLGLTAIMFSRCVSLSSGEKKCGRGVKTTERRSLREAQTHACISMCFVSSLFGHFLKNHFLNSLSCRRANRIKVEAGGGAAVQVPSSPSVCLTSLFGK